MQAAQQKLRDADCPEDDGIAKKSKKASKKSKKAADFAEESSDDDIEVIVPGVSLTSTVTQKKNKKKSAINDLSDDVEALSLVSDYDKQAVESKQPIASKSAAGNARTRVGSKLEESVKASQV